MSEQDNLVPQQGAVPQQPHVESQPQQQDSKQQPPVTADDKDQTDTKKASLLGGLLSGNTSKKKGDTQEDKERKLKLLTPFLPQDLVGGEIPYIPGNEDESVWNAASQACGTERVHYCYSIAEGRCWYLATPSSSLANAPDSWCPIAAALPGNSEHWDKETVYIYEQDGSASAIRWDPETHKMQVFLGAARTIMPRIQSLDASFVTINPEAAQPVAWKNRALRQEQLSRGLVKWLFFSGLLVTFIALFYWFASFTAAALLRPNLDEANKLSQEASLNLMREASNVYRTSVTTHIARINELSLELFAVGGELLKYEVKPDGSVEWEAVVPRAMEGDISRFSAKAEGLDDQQRGFLRIKGTR